MIYLDTLLLSRMCIIESYISNSEIDLLWGVNMIHTIGMSYATIFEIPERNYYWNFFKKSRNYELENRKNWKETIIQWRIPKREQKFESFNNKMNETGSWWFVEHQPDGSVV